MAYGTPTDPVAGTVITVAYAKSNLLDPIRWLRLLTGNADPPGSSYVVVSDSTTGTTWRKIPTDAIADGAVTTVKIPDGAITAIKLAAGAVVAHLGYTPVNRAGDTGITGSLVTTGDLTGSRLFLTVPDGSQPMNITSTTLVPNLNANLIQGQNLAALDARYVNTTGPDSMTGNFTASGDLTGSRLILNVSSGQAMSVPNTTVIPNLNASQVAGKVPGTLSGDLAILGTGGKVALAVAADTATSATSATSATNASQLGSIAAANYGRRATGAYVGNGVSPRTILVGFLCKMVIIQQSTGVTWLLLAASRSIFLNPPNDIQTDSSPLLDATDGFIVGGTNSANVNGITYTYYAFG